MKEQIKKFDFEAAFKALDELELPKVKGLRANRVDLHEACKRSDKFEALFEEYYDVSDMGEMESAQKNREDEIAKAKLARIEKIVDLDADSADDLLTSYVGKVIIQCPNCMTLFYKDPEDIEVDEENNEIVNVNEKCQHCGNTLGYTVMGKVAQADENDESAEQLDLSAQDIDTEGEQIESEMQVEDELEEEPDVEMEEVNDEEDLNIEGEEIPEEESAEEELEEIPEEEEKEARESFAKQHNGKHLVENSKANKAKKELFEAIKNQKNKDEADEDEDEDIIEDEEVEVEQDTDKAEEDLISINEVIEIVNSVVDDIKDAIDTDDEQDEIVDEIVASTTKEMLDNYTDADNTDEQEDSLVAENEVNDQCIDGNCEDGCENCEEQETVISDLVESAESELRKFANGLSDTDNLSECNNNLTEDAVSDAEFEDMLNNPIFNEVTEGFKDKVAGGAAVVTGRTGKWLGKTAKAIGSAFGDVAEVTTKAGDKLDADSDKLINKGKKLLDKEDKTAEEEVNEITDESLNTHITNFLTEVYSNVSSFTATRCEVQSNDLIVEGMIRFNSGKTKNTTFEFSKENHTFTGINESLSNDTKFIMDYSIKNKVMTVENLSYKYTINKNLVEGCTRK